MVGTSELLEYFLVSFTFLRRRCDHPSVHIISTSLILAAQHRGRLLRAIRQRLIWLISRAENCALWRLFPGLEQGLINRGITSFRQGSFLKEIKVSVTCLSFFKRIQSNDKVVSEEKNCSSCILQLDLLRVATFWIFSQITRSGNSPVSMET